jgi:purine-binding chemotaxis protein CheW
MSSESDAEDRPSVSSPELLAFADALLADGRSQQHQASAEIQQFVIFTLRDQEFGIPILKCREIVRVSTITRIPEAPDFVRGVVNLRGRVVPVVDTRKCLGLDVATLSAKARLLMVEVAGRLFGLLVDRVLRILKVPASDIAPASENVHGPANIGGVRVGESMIALLDIDRLLRVGSATEVSTPRKDEA